MGMIKKLLFLLAFIGFFAEYSTAQIDTSRVFEWNGRQVKYMKIPKGKTLYSLSKETNTPQDSLIAINPELSNGLKTGMIIKIPVGFVAKGVNKPSEKHNASLEHIVKSGETAFGISKKYGLSAEELYRQNPEARNGLKVGSVLVIHPKSGSKIPEKAEQQINQEAEPEKIAQESTKQLDEPSSSCALKGINKPREISVSFLLPFFAAGEEMNAKSKIGLDFYSGCKLALDSLKRAGFVIKARIFDTQSDSSAISKILDKAEFKESELIIGPLYASDFKAVSSFANKKGIPIISPFSQSDAILENAPSAIKITPDQKTMLEEMSRFLLKEKKMANFTLIRNSNAKDQDATNWIADIFKNEGNLPEGKFKEVTYSGVNEVIENLNESSENILIFPTSVQVQVIDAIARLSNNRLGKRITLVGLNDWNSYENIEFDHLNNLNFTYAAPTKPDFSSSASKSFQKKFKEEFKGEPTNYAFQGFDATLFFIDALTRFEKPTLSCLEKMALECGINSCYKFSRTGKDNGLENRYVNILQLNDFVAKKLN
jgi:LysM repeat protein/ABC-type branched-subunit amino acid transport system substrate-binding protein